MKANLHRMGKVDHVAIAVRDLDAAVEMYQSIFGFALLKRREVQGKFSGMRSAEMDGGKFTIVLIEGTDPASQVCRYVDRYGPGVQHIAIVVDNLEATARQLADSGAQFATEIIRGDGLLQLFTKREDNSGMMFEFIERTEVTGFQAQNIQKLFDQLESTAAY
ncbi:MAG TPA: VOC family protein [Steroidobacteraceae bacterium]|jgi:methylmalonyl-CoA epimerase|nr:VOC family protein [Steroidobacteraceae bacterium]